MIGLIAKAFASPLIKSVVDKVVPDKNARKGAREELEQILAQATAAEVQGQLEINKVEAAHRTLFVAGWRPAVGWVCAITLAFTILIVPLAEWGFVMAGREMALPEFPEEKMMLILIPMLGLGGYRTIEKLKDKAK